MTRSGEGWACDTSIAVAALDPNHSAHKASLESVLKLRPALAGHAAFEAYAVLTRLPPPLRLTGPQAAEVLAQGFPGFCWLAEADLPQIVPSLAKLGIVGGSVYDALVGKAAAANRMTLLTRDRRALRTYRILEIDFELIE